MLYLRGNVTFQKLVMESGHWKLPYFERKKHNREWIGNLILDAAAT